MIAEYKAMLNNPDENIDVDNVQSLISTLMESNTSKKVPIEKTSPLKILQEFAFNLQRGSFLYFIQNIQAAVRAICHRDGHFIHRFNILFCQNLLRASVRHHAAFVHQIKAVAKHGG